MRYYANETLNGGRLLTMLTNAKEAATYMMWLAGRDSRYVPAINDIMALEDEHERTRASRESFLNNHIERVLEDIYEDKHESLLPEFVLLRLFELATDRLRDHKVFGACLHGL